MRSKKNSSDDIQSIGLNNDNEITVGVDSTHSLEDGDRIIIKYKAVDNPDAAGAYSVDITITTSQGTTRTVTGTLEITA